MVDEKELRRIWKRYVDGKFIYRSQSGEHLKDILRDGFDHEKDPYVGVRPRLEKLYDLVLKLEKRGFKMVLDWKGVYPSGSQAVRTSRLDLDNPFIDFATNLKEARRFVTQFQGGAIAGNVIEFIEGIRKFDVKLTKAQERMIGELEIWARKKMKFKNKLLRVRASCVSLEKAKIHTFEYKKYMKSPYGSFEHFVKVVGRYGLDRYMVYLSGKKKAYVRVVSRIPAGEIEVVG